MIISQVAAQKIAFNSGEGAFFPGLPGNDHLMSSIRRDCSRSARPCLPGSSGGDMVLAGAYPGKGCLPAAKMTQDGQGYGVEKG